MARSQYIYVVTGIASRRPVAAFTVKHELITWLNARNGHSMLRIWRLGDGHNATVEIDLKYMLDNPTKSSKVIE
jgi:hypothetical protein